MRSGHHKKPGFKSGNVPRLCVIAFIIVSVFTVIAILAAPVALSQSTGPVMPDGWSAGSITGRVTTQDTTVGVGNAYVAIVDANDHDIVYANTNADGGGYYQFTGINSTADDGAYQVYASFSPLGSGLSNAFGVNSGATATTSVVIMTDVQPPVIHTPYPPMPAGWSTGAIVGRVTTQDTTVGISGANVAIVSGYDNSIVYASTTADASGYYWLTGVNSTADDEAYQVYANLSPYGSGRSHSLRVYSGATATTSVVIFTMPVQINVQSTSNRLIPNGSDKVQITACAYDFLGNKVGDGTPLFFTIGKIEDNANVLKDPNASEYMYNNGSFGAYNSSIRSDNVSTKNGIASVLFGWLPAYAGGHDVNIYAYYALNTSVYGSVDIYLEKAPSPSPSSSATATATNSPTVTTSPTASATASPTASATATVSATASPTASATTSPSPTAAATTVHSGPCVAALVLPLLVAGVMIAGTCRIKRRER
jgi:hypothetical protein